VPTELSAFLVTLAAAADSQSAARDGVAHAARAVAGDLAAWVRTGQVVAGVGQEINGPSDADLVAAGDEQAPLPGLGIAALCVSPVDGGLARLVVARRGPKPFSRAEQCLLGDMARALALSQGVGVGCDGPDGQGRATEVALVDSGGAARALQNSDHRLHEILRGARDAFIALDAEGLILDWNDEAQTTFGWVRSEALGRKLADTIIEATAREGFRSDLEAFFAQDDGAGDDLRLVVDALHRDGRGVPVELSLSRMRAGETFILQVFARDLTQAVRAERERREVEDRLAHQVLHDPLTGLPNRTLLFDRLAHALAGAKRRGSTVAVVFVDLDDFRLVNESLGHEAGDELLVAVACLLDQVVRGQDTMVRLGEDTLVRFGGDEFVMVCEDVASERDAIAIAQRVTSALGAPLSVAGEQLFVTASTGLTISTNEATPDSVVGEAEAAMGRAKKRGRGRYELFDLAMGASVFNRLHEEHELRQAIERQELRLFYQPIVSVMNAALVGAEALVRWEHPQRGLLEPAEFLPLAEETGLIVPLGRWVLGEACAQAARWQTSRACGLIPRVAVNVSGRQFADGDLVALVADLLMQTGLHPSRLALEITESVLLEGSAAPAAALHELRALGVRVSLDDFGTGYSSLSYLRHLPIDTLKLDRSFIAGLGPQGIDRQIVAAVVQMTRALSMTVVAEGVETEQQLSHLRELGCHLAQGYYFARPMPGAQMTAMLEDASTRRGPLLLTGSATRVESPT